MLTVNGGARRAIRTGGEDAGVEVSKPQNGKGDRPGSRDASGEVGILGEANNGVVSPVGKDRSGAEGSGWLIAKDSPSGWCEGRLHARAGIRISIVKLDQTNMLRCGFRSDLLDGIC
jgi:hypothetical protein